MQKRLKPCPVCGRKRLSTWMVIEGGEGYFVHCDVCGRSGKTGRTRWEAKKAWNRENRPERICEGGTTK